MTANDGEQRGILGEYRRGAETTETEISSAPAIRKSSFAAGFHRGFDPSPNPSIALSIPPQHLESSARAMHFFLQFEKLQRLLEGKIERYFFNSNPGVIRAADYQNGYSIRLLTKALTKIGEIAVKEAVR